MATEPEQTDLPKMVQITGRLLVTETVNEARLEVARLSGASRVQFSAIIDGATTPICRHLDGKVFVADSPEAKRFEPPLHINCRSIWIEVGDDEEGVVDAFDPNDPELPALVKTGHFIGDRETYAPLAVPSSPGSRDFVFRRRRVEGELVSELEWKRPRYAIPGLRPDTVETGIAEARTRYGSIVDKGARARLVDRLEQRARSLGVPKVSFSEDPLLAEVVVDALARHAEAGLPMPEEVLLDSQIGYRLAPGAHAFFQVQSSGAGRLVINPRNGY